MEINVEDLLKKSIKDEVIIFQTDTVYGIGCLLSSQKGVEKIYEIKKRDGQKPLAVLCATLEDVKTLVDDYHSIERYAQEYWPGALTIVCPKNELVGDFVTSGLPTVGVRIPDDNIALQILRKFGPMAVTSLNLSSEPAIKTYTEALQFESVVDYVVMGDDIDGFSSTVFDPFSKKVIRQGDIIIE